MKPTFDVISIIELILCLQTSIQSPVPPLFESFLKGISEAIQHMNNEPIDQPVLLKEYDFIIVGAGSAGSVLANRLTEIPNWNVLLIEAGQEENYSMDVPILANFIQFTDANWNYKTVPSENYCLAMENNQCHFPRGKVMGGSSVLNYMIYTRGHWKDYDNWANLGNSGWDYQNVLKYFKKLEDVQIPRYASDRKYRNTGGYQTISEIQYRTKSAQAFVNAGIELGYPTPDINGRYQVGFSYVQATTRNGTRCSTSKAYLHPIRNRPNLHVKKYSIVTKILIEPQTKTAYGVRFVRNKRTYQVLARKEVIVSGGAINTPQLLMLSGIGPREHLRSKGISVIRDLPVGENLMDHVALGAVNFIMNDTVTIRAQRLLSDRYKLYDFLLHHDGPYTIPGGLEALAFFDLNDLKNPDGHPNLELAFIGMLPNYKKMLQRNMGIRTSVYENLYKGTQDLDGVTIFIMVMHPKSKGRILLKDDNPFHHPLIYPNYFADERDLDVIVKGVRIAQRIMETESMKRFNATLWRLPYPGCVNYTFDSDDYWKCNARHFSYTIYHLSGTCKMAPQDDPTGVVDPRLRVKGVKNLRVADASIMPEVTSGHTNAPIIMIGEKASDLIKQDWNVKTD